MLSSDLRGTARLAVAATVAMTDLVEHMHRNIAKAPKLFGKVRPGRTHGITGQVYRNIRRITGWAGIGLDIASQAVAPLLDRWVGETSGETRDALVAALNGIVGDLLAETGNPLALPMEFRLGGETLQQHPGGRMLLLVHGLCMNDHNWLRHGHDHGAALAADFDLSPVYLRYNSGLHVSVNGRDLASRLEALVLEADQPVTELTIIGFSMGGLLARSACHYATLAGYQWPGRLRRLVFLGTPHMGAPLERGGNGLHAALHVSPYIAPLARLGRLRSAGITDLRHGNLLDEDWSGIDRFAGDGRLPQHLPLPPQPHCAALAATLGHARGDTIDGLCGDGLVPVASALGEDPEGLRALGFAPEWRWLGTGMSHLELLNRPEAYAALQAALRAPLAANV